MSEQPLVSVRREGSCCVVELNRPRKLNALSVAVERALGEAIASPLAREARCVVITGDERAFSAGADVTEFRDRDPEAIAAYYRDTGDVYERVAALPVPTIAAIAGYCLGGGLELALACDFRIAARDAVLGLPEVSIGILPSSGGTVRLVRLVGPARAKELALLHDRLTPAEAHRLGILTEVTAEDTALARALEIGERLASLPPLAVQVTKQAIDVIPAASHDAALLIERLGYGLLAQTAAAQAAAEGFDSDRGGGG